MKIRTLCGQAAGVAGILANVGAHAFLVDFENVAPNGFPTYAQNDASGLGPRDLLLPVTVGLVTGNVSVKGGTVLKNETFLPANQTQLYGSAFFGTGTTGSPSHPYLNTVTLDFTDITRQTQVPLTSFALDVFNGEVFNVTYTVADNAGHSSSFLLVPNLASGNSRIGFNPTGDVITITSDAGSLWDFSLDNITVNEGIANVPTTVVTPPTPTSIDQPQPVQLVESPPVYTDKKGRVLNEQEREIDAEQQELEVRGKGSDPAVGPQVGPNFRLVAQGKGDLAPVPLPAAFPLLASALGLIGAIRRRA